MDGSDVSVVDILESLMWTYLEADDSGRVSVNELGRYLRQQGIDVSDFAILRVLSDGTTPQFTMDHDMFVDTKHKLTIELKEQERLTPEEKRRKFKAMYLERWKELTRSRDDTGEIPVSDLQNVLFAECNPTRELLEALTAVKSDGSESINFEEFCEMLENLPQSGMIGEGTLMKAFQAEDVDGSGYITRGQLYSLLIENGSDPLRKEDVDEMMEDCGDGDKFWYKEWVQRVITMRNQHEN